MDRQTLGRLIGTWLAERGIIGPPDDIVAAITGGLAQVRPLTPDDLNDLLDRLCDSLDIPRPSAFSPGPLRPLPHFRD